MKYLIDNITKRTPSERVIMCIAWWCVGLLYATVPLISFVLRGVSMETVLIIGGFFLILATTALWYMKQWWMICFGIFIGIDLAVRFSRDVLAGEFTAILKYIVVSLVWFTVGFHMWKVSKNHNPASLN